MEFTRKSFDFQGSGKRTVLWEPVVNMVSMMQPPITNGKRSIMKTETRLFCLPSRIPLGWDLQYSICHQTVAALFDRVIENRLQPFHPCFKEKIKVCLHSDII
jgi:hypothetical protein